MGHFSPVVPEPHPEMEHACRYQYAPTPLKNLDHGYAPPAKSGDTAKGRWCVATYPPQHRGHAPGKSMPCG